MLLMRMVVAACCVFGAWQTLYAAPIKVVDDLGNTVQLAAPARRIIALAPHIVENLYSAGAGPYVVGAVEYTDYPEEAKQLPRVGAISSFSLEAILALKPDLVIVWMSTKGGQVREQLQRLGVTTYASDPHKLADVARSIRQYGILAGTQAVAEAEAERYEHGLAQLSERYRERTPVGVFYQVWFEPLQTLNGQHIISDVIRLCGGRNVFASEQLLAPRISMEAVLSQNPQAIIAAESAGDYDALAQQWAKWTQLEAVKQQHLFAIPGDYISRHTVRLLLGADLLCQNLDTVRH